MEINQQLRKLYAEVEPYVVTFYASQKGLFKSCSWDYKDIKQEILIKLWKFIVDTSEKTEEEVLKLVRKSIKRMCIDLYRKANSTKISKFTPIDAINENDYEVLPQVGTDFVFDNIRKYVNKEEYDILVEIYRNNTSLTEIAKSMGYKSEKSIREKRDRAIEKLKGVILNE